MKKPFILLIDANNLAFAQYHTHKELRSETANVNTGLIHGMFTGLLRIADLFNHAPMILVWDGDGKKWRQKQCSFYKQQRNHGEDPVYADCHEQMQIVRQFVQLLRIPELRLSGVEADDTIGILSSELQADFKEVIIRSADKDFFQLVGENVKIFRGGSGNEPINSKNIRDYVLGSAQICHVYGVHPLRWVDYKSLVGDPSDNIPSIKRGIGDVKAKMLLNLGVKFPVKKIPNLEGVRKELRGIEIEASDWEQANSNYEILQIIKSASDSRIPQEAQESLQGFLAKQRKVNFVRNFSSIDMWTLVRELRKFDLHDLAMRGLDLIKIFH